MKTAKTQTGVLVEGALMIALTLVLSYVKIFDLPYGGSISLEMIPLVLMSFRNGTKAGVLTSFAYSILGLILGFSNVMYCPTLFTQFACIMLDYVLAFTVLGFSSFFAGLFGEKKGLFAATFPAHGSGVRICRTPFPTSGGTALSTTAPICSPTRSSSLLRPGFCTATHRNSSREKPDSAY